MLLFVSRLPAQNPTQTPVEPPHRFEYPAEHFSIELPAPWSEIDQAAVSQVGSATAVLMPNAPKFKFNHAYTSSDLASHAVIVMLTGDHLSEAAFKDLDGVSRAASKLAKGFLSGSMVQGVQLEYTSYDTGRHLHWGTSKGNSVLAGEVRTLAGVYITNAGTIQVACYAKSAEFEKHQAECKEIIGSVKIDPDVALTPPAPLSELLRMATDQASATYRQLVERVRAGDFSVDFRALRMACARSKVCEVRATPDELADMGQAGREQRQTDAVEICERLISHGFINMEAHVACSQAYTALNRPDQAKFHLDIMTALFQSVLNAGDGKTEETAYEVISVREQYAVLAGKGLPQSGEGVLSHRSYSAGGHNYSRWEVRHPKTQEKVVVFFNTDAVPPAK
jgi:hypothetical protein